MAVIPLLNLDGIFGIALINCVSLDIDRYLFDLMPATRETIVGSLCCLHISSKAFKASLGFTAKKNRQWQ